VADEVELAIYRVSRFGVSTGCLVFAKRTTWS